MTNRIRIAALIAAATLLLPGCALRRTQVNDTTDPALSAVQTVTEAPTETEKVTETESATATETVTETATETVTDTEAPTEPPTEAPTEPVTEAPTMPVTEAPPAPVTEAPTMPVTEAVTDAPAAATPEEILASMTLEEKVGQLFFTTPTVLRTYGGYAKGMAKYPVGGIFLSLPDIETEEQFTGLISDLQDSSKLPLFICLDEEGGTITRLAAKRFKNLPVFETLEEIAESGDVERARVLGYTIGSYLRRYGVNLDLAPVADVNTNPLNTVIGDRAFGSDPAVAAKMVAACVEGFHSQGIMTTLKHFPGHGDTVADSHYGYVGVKKTWEEMLSCEIVPFAAGIAAGTDMVMVAHVTAENVSGDGLPSTLSYTMVTEKLRGELGFDGVVITDGMQMEAIKKQYGSAQSSILAIKAGCDIILVPDDLPASIAGVTEEVRSGGIAESRIDESVLRILRLKAKYGMI